jgi:hypothetical protein
LRAAVDRFAHQVAPDSLAERERRAFDRRRLNVTRSGDGSVAVEGRLDPLGAETVMTAIAARSAPAGADDERTPEQRRADALVQLAREQLDTGQLPDTGGARPHVTVVVDLDTLQQREGAAPGLLDRLGAVSGATARLLACDAAVTRVLTAGGSQILDVGRATRVVSVAQRRALAVRDKGCISCHAPVAWCDAHHVRFWADGGPTDLHNLVLLCPRCHRSVHDRRLRPIRGPDGTWTTRTCQPRPG